MSQGLRELTNQELNAALESVLLPKLSQLLAARELGHCMRVTDLDRELMIRLAGGLRAANGCKTRPGGGFFVGMGRCGSWRGDAQYIGGGNCGSVFEGVTSTCGLFEALALDLCARPAIEFVVSCCAFGCCVHVHVHVRCALVGRWRVSDLVRPGYAPGGAPTFFCFAKRK